MKKIKIELPETKEEIKEAIKRVRKIEGGKRGKISPLIFIPSCENCVHEGGAFWHCHNPNSPKCHINVNKEDVCSHYSPNWGLMTYLWYRAFQEDCRKSRVEDIKFLKKLEEKKNEKNN